MIDIVIHLGGSMLAFIGAYFIWLIYKILKSKLLLILFIHALVAGTIRLLMLISTFNIGITIGPQVSRFLLLNYILFCWAMIALWQTVRHFIIDIKKAS